MVPEGWSIKTVDELFHVQLGKMLNKVAKEKHPQLPYLGNSNVQWGYFDLSNLQTMYFSEREIGKFSLRFNDILMCEGGEVGRCAIWQGNDDSIFYQKALHRLRTKGEIIPLFFQAYMENISGTKLLESHTTRTSIAHLTREKLCRLPVQVPTLAEQKKIAQILYTWDKAITTTEQLLANSQQQKKALMQQLLTGKKRLLDEDGVRFSGEWKDTALSEMGRIVSGGTPDTKKDEYWGGAVSWLTPTDVTALKSRYVTATSRTITEKGLRASSATLLPAGSLMVCTRATVGAAAISTSEITTNQGFKSLIPSKQFDVGFIYYLLAHFNKKLTRKASGSTFLELSKRDFEKTSFECPSLQEQIKISEALANADQELETLNKKLSLFKCEKQALMQQLLTGKRRVKVDEEAAA